LKFQSFFKDIFAKLRATRFNLINFATVFGAVGFLAFLFFRNGGKVNLFPVRAAAVTQK